MLVQQERIARVRALCERDERISAALMYGSFSRGEGDAHSDIEFWLFVRSDELPGFDAVAWIAGIAPVLAVFVNEYETTVAVFEDGMRGEFHVAGESRIGEVRAWRSLEGCARRSMLVVDRTGALATALADAERAGPRAADRALAQATCDRLLNWLLLGHHVLARGEEARALAALAEAHRFLLQAARIAERAFAHWLTPSRALEADLSSAARARFARCTAALDRDALRAAYAEAWRWGGELSRELAAAWGREARAAAWALGPVGRP